MTILTSGDYPAIRAALDVGLNAQQLPDATIAQDIFLGAAEAELLRRIPMAASLTGDDLARVKRALVWLTAAFLAHSVIRITSMSIQTRDLSYSRQTFDPDEKAAELRARAEAEFGMLLTPTEVAPSRPTMFTLAAGHRGR
ncbi:MAG: hypothetical protein M9896_13780 [Candidatus Promineofilum sp.]|uniref:hypothetical protein n=1 Tax=Promineifilum sp. TaxID=2664178 RepID=UPI002411C330|nr:hypothetical protein [Promineifilum sp.]